MTLGTIGSASVRFVGKDDTASALRNIVRNTETASKQIGSKLRSALNFLGAGTAFYSLTRAIGQTIKMGDDLAKFASKSGLGAEAASELAHAAKMADVDLATFATGIRNMQIVISESSEVTSAAAKTLNALGLSFKDLKDLSPDEQFELLAEQISKLGTDFDKTRARSEIFKRSGEALAAVMEGGAASIRAAREEAQEFGKSFTEEDLRLFSDADRAFKELAESSRGLAAELTLKLGPALIGAANAAKDLLKGDIDWGKLAKIASGGPIGGLSLAGQMTYQSGAGSLNSARDRANQAMGRAAFPFIGNGLPGAGKVAGGFGSTKDDIDGLNKVIVTAQRIVPGFAGIYTEMLENTATAAQKAGREYEAFKIQLEELLALGPSNGGITKDEFNLRLGEYFDENLKAVEVTAQKLVLVNERAKSLMATFKDESARQLFTSISSSLANATSGAGKFKDSMIQAFIHIMANRATLSFFEGMSSLGNKGTSKGLLGTIGSFFGGFLQSRDSGGPGEAGNAYLIGRGAQPELFIPKSAGTFIPKQGLGGMGSSRSPITINYAPNIDARGATTDFVKALPHILKTNNAQLLAFIRDQRSRGAF